jgi:F-type H+-transporting ATPase subunit gamma
MKTLAAVSIRQYEKALESLADYNRTVELGLHVVLRDKAHAPKPARFIPGNRLGAIIFGSDYGLCGRFNEDITRFATAKMNGFQVRHEDRLILSVGARADARLEEAGLMVEECFMVPGSAANITATVQQILLKLEEWQSQSEVKHVLLFYNQHVRRTTHQPHMLHLLPVDLERFQRLLEEPWPSRVIPTYTMESDPLFSSLIRQYFFVSLFRACAESLASEHASRLASMQGAEKNIKERMQELDTQFQQQRQDAITEELLDVISGFEVLTGSNAQRSDKTGM